MDMKLGPVAVKFLLGIFLPPLKSYLPYHFFMFPHFSALSFLYIPRDSI